MVIKLLTLGVVTNWLCQTDVCSAGDSEAPLLVCLEQVSNSNVKLRLRRWGWTG